MNESCIKEAYFFNRTNQSYKTKRYLQLTVVVTKLIKQKMF